MLSTSAMEESGVPISAWSQSKGIKHYGQPITTIEMDSGCKVRFSVNFGQVKEEERADFFERL